MNNIEDVKQRIIDSLGGKVKSIDFVNATITDRPWFFGGISKVVEGNDIDEVDISVMNGLLSVNGKITPDSKLIPLDTSKLYIYTPIIEKNEIASEQLIESITSSIREQNLISEKRPLDIVIALMVSVEKTEKSEDFIRIFISELIKNGEIRLSSKKLPELIEEIVDIMNITHREGVYCVSNFIQHNLIVLEFYEGDEKIMYASFPLTHKGFYGFATLLHTLAKHNNFNIRRI